MGVILCNMSIIDISSEIINDISSFDSNCQSISFVTSWLRSKVGNINLLIDTSFSIDNNTLEITPTPTIEQKAIFVLLYQIFYYTIRINAGLGANAFNAIVEVDQDGTRTRLVNRNEIAKTFIQLKKDVSLELDALVNEMKRKNVSAVQVHGDDSSYFFSYPAPVSSRISYC